MTKHYTLHYTIQIDLHKIIRFHLFPAGFGTDGMILSKQVAYLTESCLDPFKKSTYIQYHSDFLNSEVDKYSVKEKSNLFCEGCPKPFF